MKRMTKSEGGSTTPIPPRDVKFWESFPLLTEHLTAHRWDDGSPREVSTLTISVVDGALNVCLNDRAEGRGLFVTADTFRDAVKSLEANLSGQGTSRWVTWRKFKKG